MYLHAAVITILVASEARNEQINSLIGRVFSKYDVCVGGSVFDSRPEDVTSLLSLLVVSLSPSIKLSS